MRYAFYITPPEDDPLSRAAACWLGSNVFDGTVHAPATLAGFTPEDRMELTADPRRYGFHGTLKAPFELADGRTEAQLLDAAEAFAARCSPFDVPEMVLDQIGPFFALVPAGACAALSHFADETVRHFEPFRADLSQADIARRRPERLTESQRHHLLTWGYPYVFEDFRFHMTLTGPVPAEKQAAVRSALETAFSDFIGKTLPIEALALFVEPQRGAPFNVHSLLPLGGPSKPKDAVS